MVQEFLPEAAHDELSDALLLAIAAPGHERLSQHGQLGPYGKERSREEAKGRSWHRNRPLVAHDITGAGFRIGIEPPGRQPGVVDELGDLGRGFEYGIGPKLRQIALRPDRLDRAANAVAGLIDRDRHALAMQVECGGEARDACPDDCHGLHIVRENRFSFLTEA